MQECENARMQECRNAGMRECRNARMQECKNAGIRECENARIVADFNTLHNTFLKSILGGYIIGQFAQH